GLQFQLPRSLATGGSCPMQILPRRIALAIVAAIALPAIVIIPRSSRAADVPPFAKAVPKVQTGNPIFAFNGKDLAGVYTYLKESKYEDPKGVVTVKDGAIRVSGEDYGGFTTKEEFHDYHLIVEWKWGGATYAPRKQNARDSGILLHCVGPDGSYSG